MRWALMLVLAMCCAHTASAQDETTEKCDPYPLEWVKSEPTPLQHQAFIAPIGDGVGIKWSTWKDGDQTMSINVFEGPFAGLACMAVGSSKDRIGISCMFQTQGLSIHAMKDPGKNTQVLVCEKVTVPAPAPKKPAVPPLPPNAAGKSKVHT